MNYTDAIEGTVRVIIQHLHEHFVDGNQDDSEYIRNIRLTIDGAAGFVADHPELMIPLDVFKDVLYQYAKQLWMDSVGTLFPAQAAAESHDYRDYYFDYIYAHGTYPR